MTEEKKDVENVATTEIEVKNVLDKNSKKAETLKVNVVPFDRYNDAHVEFAYSYSDMLYKAPSDFKSVNDAARAYVKLFIVHKVDDEKKESSTFSKVANDLRACRTMFNQDGIMLALNDFFENA